MKETNAEEITVSFYQGIYDATGELVEIHRKHPVDTGHQGVSRGEEVL
ncbi:MAG TPA: hypothetical protein PKE45_21295 [Caldilineaceae bacterium]|nr:hypothetical protein [Caldilineaceae bacterium]